MRSHRLWRALSERRGEGYVDVIVLVLCAVMVLALAMRVLPIFIQKQQLDTFATERRVKWKSVRKIYAP